MAVQEMDGDVRRCPVLLVLEHDSETFDWISSEKIVGARCRGRWSGFAGSSEDRDEGDDGRCAIPHEEEDGGRSSCASFSDRELTTLVGAVPYLLGFSATTIINKF